MYTFPKFPLRLAQWFRKVCLYCTQFTRLYDYKLNQYLSQRPCDVFKVIIVLDMGRVRMNVNYGPVWKFGLRMSSQLAHVNEFYLVHFVCYLPCLNQVCNVFFICHSNYFYQSLGNGFSERIFYQGHGIGFLRQILEQNFVNRIFSVITIYFQHQKGF
jgi:hypothetical protein